MTRLLGIVLMLLLSFAAIAAPPAQKAPEEQTSTQHYPVGELGKLWQFPSDHLPIGGSIGDLHFAMWNILSTQFLSFIKENGQGLRDSLIMTANVPVEKGKPLTVREQMIIDQVMQMFQHKTHPRALIALEEVNDAVFQELERIKPPNMAIIMPFLRDPNNRDIFIFNKDRLTTSSYGGRRYENSPNNVMSFIQLKDIQTGIRYYFIQSHVPGGPVHSPEARKAFAAFVFEKFNPERPTIIMGDMNRSADYFEKDFTEAFKNKGLDIQPYENQPIPYPTHIDTHREATWIDNLFIYNPYSEIPIKISADPAEFFDGLKPTMDLLKERQLAK
jgi:hypothetical protein